MRDTGHIFHAVNLDVEVRHGADGRITTEPDTFDEDVDRLHAMQVLYHLGCFLGRNLGGVCRTLLATAETASTGARGTKNCALLVGERDDGVIE